jgi:hypothetical protein
MKDDATVKTLYIPPKGELITPPKPPCVQQKMWDMVRFRLGTDKK